MTIMETVPSNLLPSSAPADRGDSHVCPERGPGTNRPHSGECGYAGVGGAFAGVQVELPVYTKIGPATDMEWLFQGRIPRRQVTLIEGANGAGKSFVALDLAARFTRGLGWPAPWHRDLRLGGDAGHGADRPHSGECGYGECGYGKCTPLMGNVLLVTQQDDSATVDRRLAGLGADIDRVCRIETV
jgi:hypothetical protein